MLLLAETPTAESLLPVGYLTAVAPPETLDAEVERLCNQLIGNAPLTIAATRETLRRLESAAEVDITDLIRACYGSDDFHRSVTAFLAGTRIEWDGK
jgi:enoyl-CoA hydratase